MILDSNGVAGTETTATAPLNSHARSSWNGHPPRDAAFWQHPLDKAGLSETIWHPPLPSDPGSQQAAAESLNEIAKAHAAGDWNSPAQPYQAWYLRWFFETRAHAAQRELEDVLAEVRAATRSYAALLRDEPAASEGSHQAATAVLHHDALHQSTLHHELSATPEVTLNSLLARARHDFTKAAAEAKLFVDTGPVVPEAPPTAPVKRQFGFGAKKASVAPGNTSTAPEPTEAPGHISGHISPRRVEEALDRAAPNLPEIAGMHHLRYPQAEWHSDGSDSLSWWQRSLAQLTTAMLHLAPLVLGLMVALCLGSVSGLLDIEDLTRNPDVVKVSKFVLAVFLGSVVVAVLGKAIEATVRTLFDHLTTPVITPPQTDEATVEGFQMMQGFRSYTPPSPRRRRTIVGVCLLVLAVFAIAETVAEGTGLKTLNDLRLANMSQAHLRQYNANPIPIWAFYLVGMLFSAAYLYYKGVDTWRRGELEALRPWLARRRQEWIETQRGEDNIKALFRLAYLIEQMEAQRESLRLRLDNARAAAVSEAELLHAMIEWVVNSREEMPMPTLHVIKHLDTANSDGAMPDALKQ